MFNSPVIEVAIGLATVFLVLSMIVTSVVQMVSQALSMRGGQLKKTLGNLLGEVAAGADKKGSNGKSLLGAFYDSPYVSHFCKPGAGLEKKKLPATIDANAFVGALQHAVTDSFEVKEDIGTILAAAKKVGSQLSDEEAQLLKDPNVQKFLEYDIGKSLSGLYGRAKLEVESGISRVTDATARFEQHVADWYDSAMDEANNWFRDHMRIVSLIIGVCVTLAFNADSLTIAKSIWDSKEKAAAIDAIAQNYAEKAVEKVTPQNAKEELGNQVEALNSIIESTKLPLGWREGSLDKLTGSLVGFLGALAGWTVTAFALSLGAPFWYDLLRRVFRVRNTIKQTEKELLQPQAAPPATAPPTTGAALGEGSPRRM